MKKSSKYISIIKDLHQLNEIGEGTAKPFNITASRFLGVAPYDYLEGIYEFDVELEDQDEPVPGKITLSYDQEDDQLKMNNVEAKHGVVDIEFRIFDPKNPDFYSTTNFGISVLTRIMATVIKCMGLFEKKLKSENIQYDIVVISPAGEKMTGVSRQGELLRSKLYDRYIRKHLDIEKVLKYPEAYHLAYFLKNPRP